MSQGANARIRYDEHLLPEQSVYTNIDLRIGMFAEEIGHEFNIYADYEENVVRVLKDAFAYEIVARVVTFPSFEPESATVLQLKENEYKILHFAPSIQLLHFEQLEIIRAKSGTDTHDRELIEYLEYLKGEGIEIPATREEVQVNRCELPISEALGLKLASLWSEMLFRTRYPSLPTVGAKTKPALLLNSGIDGTRYHFSYEYPGFTLAGNIWSPREASITGRFVQISERMKQACLSEKNELILAELEERTDELSGALTELLQETKN